jgi:hypothetical protein
VRLVCGSRKSTNRNSGILSGILYTTDTAKINGTGIEQRTHVAISQIFANRQPLNFEVIPNHV